MANFKNLTVQDLLVQENWMELICVDEDATVADVVTTLGKNKIISAPVRNSHNLFEGIIDMLDLITLCVTKFSKVSVLAYESWQQMEEFAQKKVKDLLNISGRNPRLTMSYKVSITELLAILSATNAHRVAVINEAKDVVGLVTQSKLVDFLYKHRGEAKDKMASIRAADIARSPVTSVNMNQFVIDAFKQIWDQQVTGVAVVDNEGKLVGNISASDLVRTHVKPVGPLIHDLYQPIKHFNNIRTNLTEKVYMGDLASYPPITVKSSDSLETIMETVVNNKVHRVYLVDDALAPVGVISLSDIIRTFAPSSQ
jgi:CBS domain-containing protein